MHITRRLFPYILVLTLIFQVSCAQDRINVKDVKIFKEPKNYNFKFIGYDINIDNPERDRRSYYQIYINKIEVGRTSIGLESQLKIFEYTIQRNRHLLMIKKWALNEKEGKYYKLNNINQPKPNYIYFTLPEDKIVVVTLENDVLENRSLFEIGFE